MHANVQKHNTTAEIQNEAPLTDFNKQRKYVFEVALQR